MIRRSSLLTLDPLYFFFGGADLLFGNGEARGATFDYTVPLSGAAQANVPEPMLLDKDAEARRIFGGVYGSAEWLLAPRVTLSAGLRLNVTSERRAETISSTRTRPSGSLGALVTLWEAGIDHLRSFASYRDTFKPAAFDFSLAENEGILAPETSRSYEAGLKWRTLEGSVDVEASAFRMDLENLVTGTVVNNLPALVNAGITRFKGVDLATDVRLVPAVTARATYGFHDGKFVDFVQAFDGVPKQLGGNRFEMSARHIASAGLTFAPQAGLVASMTANYVGDRYLDKRNRALASPFTTVDASLGFRHRQSDFRLDARNLTDRRDPVSESEFGDAQYYRMPARTVRAGVSVSY